MSFSPKDWRDSPNTSTPITAAALEDLESRLSDYTDDAVAAAELAVTYKGTWNASTNSPSLSDGTGTEGDFYLVSVAASRNLGSGSISWAAGDYAIYESGVWIRIAWSGSKELGYASITSSFSTASTSFVDATGLTVTVTGRGHPYYVEFWASDIYADAASQVDVGLFEGATQLAACKTYSPAAHAMPGPLIKARVASPGTSSHTYKIQIKTAAGNGYIEAGATFPAYIKVAEA